MFMELVSTPQQQRSQQTYEALLASAEGLLTRKSFQSVSLAEICEGAGCTTGAFYHRFADKKALLVHLEDRVYDRAHALIDEVFLEARQLTGRSLIQKLIAGVVDFYLTHQGSIRAMTLAVQSDPEARRRHSRRGAEVVRRGSELMARGLGSARRDADRSIEFALVALRAVLREVVLFGSEELGRFPRDVLVAELTEQFTRYLGLRGEEW